MDTMIHTDGSYMPGAAGGYAALIRHASSSNCDVVFGQVPKQDGPSSPRMELLAAVRALESLVPQPEQVHVVSDSKYLVDNVGRIQHWKNNGWRTVKRQAVANQDLWERLDDSIALHQAVTFSWVKGHAGHPDNEIVDQLSRHAAVRPDYT